MLFIFSLNSGVDRRPGPGEAFVRDPPEQLCIGSHQLVELEPVAIVSAVELERPTRVLELLSSSRRLDHAVKGDELGYDQLSHGLVSL
jgi:hypothetical protein